VLPGIRDEIKQEIVGVLLVALTVLTYLGLFSPAGGGFGDIVKQALGAAFGDASLLVPACVGLAGLLCVFQRGHVVAGSRLAGWLLGLVAVLGWFHRFEPAVADVGFENIRFGLGGGYVGYAVNWALMAAFGPLGRDVVLAALTLIALLLATDSSLVTFALALWHGGSATARFLGRGLGRLVGLFERQTPRRQRPLPNQELRGGVERGQANSWRGTAPRWGLREQVRPGRSERAGRTGAGSGLGVDLQGARERYGFGPRPGSGGLAPDGFGPGNPASAGARGGGLVAVPGAGTDRTPRPAMAAAPPAAGAQAGVPATDERRGYEQMALTDNLLYELPSLSILDPVSPVKTRRLKQDLDDAARQLEAVLASYGVSGRVIDARRGPVVTRFEYQPAPGIKVARISSLTDDIAMNMAAESVRIEAPIPGKHAVGIEIPNREVSTVPLREVLEDPEVRRLTSKLTLVLGKEITGRPITGDLDRLLHILIAGATGSGKSVCLNAMIASLLFRAKPSEVKFLLIDPKVVELSVYEGIPHLVAPVVTDPKKAAGCLRWAVKQMEDRYELFAAAGVRDIGRYNDLVGGAPSRMPGEPVPEEVRPRMSSSNLPGPNPLPYIIIVIDELADLMMVAPVEVENLIFRLAQMGRAAGIHLMVATQRPTVDVLTGTIKANIPTRVAFAVASQVDSRTIIDTHGAEKLLGHGDMLFMPIGATKPIRVQGAFISDREIEALVEFVRGQAKPRYVPDVLATEAEEEDKGEEADDELFEEAVRVVMESGSASISLLQRRLRVGYTRAGRLIDMMEEAGIVGPFEGSKAREILMTWDSYRRSREAARRLAEQRTAQQRGRFAVGSVPRGGSTSPPPHAAARDVETRPGVPPHVVIGRGGRRAWTGLDPDDEEEPDS